MGSRGSGPRSKEQISSSVLSRSVPELSREEVSTANPYFWAIHALPVAPQ